MRGHPEQIDQAQLELAAIVSRDLSGHGWVQRDLDRHGIAVLTRDTGNGVMATAELFRTSFQWPEDWPIEVGVRIGVGYEPALNLMPLLTLHPDVALLAADRQQSEPGFTITLGAVGDVATAARDIVAVITDQAVPFARHFADATAIDAALSEPRRRRRRPASTDAPHDGNDVDDVNNGNSDDHTEQRLLLLAAMGRHDETRTLLTTYPSRHGDEPIDRDDRRFIRQLTRWLDADGPTAPPIADTLAQLPREPRPPRPAWAAARAATRQHSEARDAVKPLLHGKNVDEITDILAAEYARRDIDISPVEVGITAQALHLQQQPFGRARSTLKGLRLLKASVTDIVRTARNRTTEEPPQWLQPPERATYPMPHSRNTYTAVTADPDGHRWIAQAWADTHDRVGPFGLVDVWLTTDSKTADIIAHIGRHRVGVIPAPHADAYRQTLRAAAVFDEDPVTRGRLSKLQPPRPALLEIRAPN